MGQGKACKCGRDFFFVIQRYCNFSAFSGYRQTPSDYSAIVCAKCGAVWRTKAGYVASLPDAPADYSRRGRAALVEYRDARRLAGEISAIKAIARVVELTEYMEALKPRLVDFPAGSQRAISKAVGDRLDVLTARPE
jgi:hypothetical protein